MSLRLAELDRLDLRLEDEEAPAQSVDVALADLVEWSRATALEKLGEGERGLRIARAWLRPRLEPGPTL